MIAYRLSLYTPRLYLKLGLEEVGELDVGVVERLALLVVLEVGAGGSKAVHVVRVPLDKVVAGVGLLEGSVQAVDGGLVLALRGEEEDGGALDLLGVGDVDEPSGALATQRPLRTGWLAGRAPPRPASPLLALSTTHEGCAAETASNSLTFSAVTIAFQPQQKPAVPTLA